MAAVEAPRRKRLTTFTIESIVGRSRSVSPSSKSSLPPASSTRLHVEDSPPQRCSSSRKPMSSASSVSTSTSSVVGATSAGRHLELLAHFAAPSLSGCGPPAAGLFPVDVNIFVMSLQMFKNMFFVFFIVICFCCQQACNTELKICLIFQWQIALSVFFRVYTIQYTFRSSLIVRQCFDSDAESDSHCEQSDVLRFIADSQLNAVLPAFFIFLLKLNIMFLMFFFIHKLMHVLFRTNNIETVKVCQFFFGISLPSVVLRSRTDKFEQKFSLCADLVKAVV